MIENKDDTNRWRNTQCSRIGRINIVKMTILTKAVYRADTTPIKLSMVYFIELEKNNLKICIETQKTLNSQVKFSRSVMSDSLRPHESQQARPRCPSPAPGVHPDLRPSSQ